MPSIDDTSAIRVGRGAGFAARGVSNVRLLARRFPVLTFIAVGAICGMLAVTFHRFVEFAYENLVGRALEQEGALRVLYVLGTPVLTFTVLAWIIRRFAPRAVGANLARVRMAYNDNPSLIGPRSILATFGATPLSLGAGAPLGPEGPIVVISSGVSVMLGRALRLPRRIVRGMIPIGTAAGIAAVFNTPITAVVFALEEIIGTAERGVLGGVLVGAVSAAVVERIMLGGQPLLAAPFSTWTDPREMLGFALIGVASGLTSGAAIAATHRLKRRWSHAMPSMVKRAALAGLLIGAAGLIAPEILSVGYDSVSIWLHGGSTAYDTATAFTVKLAAFIIAISAGVIGGTFAPSLFIGTALGAAVGLGAREIFPTANIDPKAYAILGMGSFFAGLLRSPIAAVLIVVELTGDYELILPLMLAVSLAVSVSRRVSRLSMVEQQMLDEGYIERSAGGRDPLARIRTGDAMTANVVTVDRNATIEEAARTIAGTRFAFYPVVEADDRLRGIIRREAIHGAVTQTGLTTPVTEALEEPLLVAAVDDLLIDVVHQMQIRGVDRCPVVDSHDTRRVVGFLSPSDILRVRLANEQTSRSETFDLFE